jgi:Ca-activated chloride channel family protein
MRLRPTIHWKWSLHMMTRKHIRQRFGRFMALSAFVAAVALSRQAPARQHHVDLHVGITMDGRAQIVIPQSRGFVFEQRGQAVQIESVEARVTIREQTASTTMEVRLRNPSAQQVEAVILLPVPDGAVVSAFAFEGAASEPTAQLLPKDQARRLYNEIVNKIRDPALLEFAGYNLIRSSVFPVPAGGGQKVRLTYENLLPPPADGNRIDYLLPRSESLDRRCPWRIEVDVQAKGPISTVYSPSHDIVALRRSDRHFTVRLAERSQLDPGSFRLSYLRERHGEGGGASGKITATMFAYPDPKVGGGYFLVMAGLPASIADHSKSLKREVTIVIDRSGSMAGTKMDQARAAALQVMEGLDSGEWFNIIDYSTSVSSFAPKPVKKDRQTAIDARKYLESIHATGGTNIHDALLEALRPLPADSTIPIVLFLTDGLPTVGQTSELAIRELAEKANPHHRRVFTFGVGNDVNVPLLDRIADVTRASTTYVLPDEDVEVKVAGVFRRLYGPVLADLAMNTLNDRGEISTRMVRDVIPSKLPDLFEGDQLILLGQYRDEGPITFKLSGNFLGEARHFEFHFDFSGATTKNAFVPRLWASRRIAYLVDEVRQAGAASAARPNAVGESIFNDPRFRELADEILRLSTEFGILTEYTAFLATEGANLSDWESLRSACSGTLDSRAVKSRSGQTAVNQGINFNAQKTKECSNPSDNRYVDQTMNEVEITTVQQVCDRAFFKRGRQWIDSRLIQPAGKVDALQPDVVVNYGSAEHRALLTTLIAENRQGVLSLNGDIMIQYQGKNILICNNPN